MVLQPEYIFTHHRETIVTTGKWIGAEFLRSKFINAQGETLLL